MRERGQTSNMPATPAGTTGHADPLRQCGDPRLEWTELAVGAAGSFGKEGHDAAGAKPAQRFLHARGSQSPRAGSETPRPIG